MPQAKIGIVVFPGSNCDHDAYYVCNDIMKTDTKFLWHKDSSIGDRNIIILPGGFSYGDYLRCGAVSGFSSIMTEVIRFAKNGGVVIGICNGFQILCECGLLPGALLKNTGLKFICDDASIKVENNKTIFTGNYGIKENIIVPVAHGEGNYYCDEDTLSDLISRNEIVFTYNNNQNGSLHNIAGIQNKERNVLGMMPHPERASDEKLGLVGGKRLFESVIQSVTL